MKKYLNKHLKETIYLIIIIIFSLLNIKKSYLLKSEYSSFFNKQLLWILISFILYIFIYKIKFKYIYKSRYILYLINIFLLIYVLKLSKPINNIRAWINIKGFTFQPSELLKISLPLILIALIKNKRYLLSFVIFFTPFILIILEPDTGNAILLFMIFIYLISNKKNLKYIKTLLFIIIVSLTSLIFIYKYKTNFLLYLFDGKLYYRIKRIINIKNNYQINNALIGIGNAKVFPIQFNKLLIYIPEGITDFMFSFHICNFGIICTIILLICYLGFTSEIYKRYLNTKNKFHKKLIGSFLSIFIIEELYNILMNIGLVPIMGVPLPFFSYGGSNMITFTIFYALINKKIIL